ncbi:MAG: Kelch repeat-containing protein [Myxococcota bacterium]
MTPFTVSRVLATTWVLGVTAVEAGTWTQLNPTGDNPARSDGAGLAYDSQSERLILLGQHDACPNGDIVYAYNFQTNSWQNMNTTMSGSRPPGRGHHGMAYDSQSDRVIVFGGQGCPGNTTLDDTWAYDFNNNRWESMDPTMTSPRPSARFGQQMAYDSQSDRIILYGRYGSGGDETWAYDYNNNRWENRNTAASPAMTGSRPPAISLPAVAYDSARDRILVFGSSSAQTWAYDYDNNRWESLASASTSRPNSSDEPAMVYDTQSDRIILEDEVDQTWSFHPVAPYPWTNETPATRPVVHHFSMVYVPPLDRAILVGGAQSGATPQTWSFDYDAPGTNRAPVLSAIGNRTVVEGANLSFTVTATDPDGDALTFSASNLPSGATFNPATRAFSWTPAVGQAGVYSVTISVSDGVLSDSETFSMTVTAAPPPNRPPVLDSIGNRTVVESSTLSFAATATDPDGDALTFSASNLPSGATFNPATRAFSWTPSVGQAGVYSVTISVSDGVLSDAETFSITVTAAPPNNRPPVLGPIGERTVVEGATLTFVVTASDPDGDALTLSASPLPSGASFDPSTGGFLWSPTAGQQGNHAVTFSVTDGVLTDSEVVTLRVEPAATPDSGTTPDGGPMADAGPPVDTDAGPNDSDAGTSEADGGETPVTTHGCGCTSSSTPAGWMLPLGLLFLAYRALRRRSVR